MSHALLLACAAAGAAPIDRRAVVSRHDPTVVAPNASALNMKDTFQLGNGAFAFNADITGLQTFNASYDFGVNTLADWQMHTTPFAPGGPANASRALSSYNFTYYATPLDGKNATRSVPYANADGNAPAVISWFATNPHRLNLGQLSLRVAPDAGASRALELASVSAASQRLSLHEGVLFSNFTVAGDAATPTCARVEDNAVATFSCGAGATITGVPFASYGEPAGSCASGFAPAPACASANASAVLAALCVGREACSLLVNFQAGFGDPCAGRAKWLAANVTCSAAPPAPEPPFAVAVRTAVDPDVDLVAVDVACAAGAPCPLALRLAFAYGSPGASGADWSQPAAHSTTLTRNESAGADGRGRVTLLRALDGDAYRVDCGFDGGLVFLAAPDGAAHAFEFRAAAGARWTAARVSCLFTPLLAGALAFPVGDETQWLVAKAALSRALLAEGAPLPLFPLVAAAAAAAWGAFWGSGAFLDLASANADPAAFELERRVVLSRYLMRVNSAGAEPPQETGLLCNSWSGKHHNEMRFWHLAHWGLWGNPEFLARSDAFFFAQLQNATSFATFEGYPGAHWPKETAVVANRSGITVPWLGLDHAPWPFGGAPNGTLLAWESPQVANALVIWQQPHVIWLADLQRRAANASGGNAAALAVARAQLPLVLATADYLAARVFFNESAGAAGEWWLGPPVLGGQECGDPTRTFNPVFETVYLALALDVANDFRAALGLPRDERYDAVARNVAPLHTDPAAPPGAPRYTFDDACVCQLLPGGAHDPACEKAWVPAAGSNCPPLAEHPLMIGVYGMINGRARGDRYGVDVATANNTLAGVWANWGAWRGAWGWDDSLLASGMARLGWDPSTIVNGPLADPKFPYYKNGHTLCCPVYLPGNGGLLLSVAMLAAGSDSSPPMYFPEAWGARGEGFGVAYP
jgi:hypothetical protein